MAKPELTTLNQLTPVFIQEYERYLPTAFDESMSLIQKINKVIKSLQEMYTISNTLIEQWNAVIEWVMNDGLNEGIITRLNQMLEDGTFADLLNNVLIPMKANKVDVGATIVYYVSPNGLDANDGSQTTPFLTIKKAIDTIQLMHHVINGTVRIDLAAGTYEGNIYVEKLTGKIPIEIVGKTFSNGVPSTVIDGSINTSHTYGFSFNGECKVMLKDIKVVNYRNGDTSDTNKYGIYTQNFSILYLSNVTVSNCGRGVFASANCRLNVEGGLYENNAVGIEAYASCVFYVGYKGVPTILQNNVEAGLRVFHHSEGHIDLSTISNNKLGIDIKNASRVHATNNTISSNEVGVYCVTASTWFNDNNTFTSNTKDLQYGSYSVELSDRNLLSPLYRSFDGESVNLTGNTDLTIMKSIVLPRNIFQKGNGLRIKVFGTFGLSGVETAIVTCYLGGTNIFGSTSQAGSTNAFVFEWNIIGRSGDKIITHRKAMDNDKILTNQVNEFNYAPDIVLTLSIRGQLTNVSDSMKIDGFIVENIYG